QIDTIIYGFRPNEISKNYELTDLEGKRTYLNDLMDNKNLMLIDFWGTWCAPCKELTSDLVELHNIYGENISFVSLAFELDPQPVKEYVVKNKMNWFNGFIKGKPKSIGHSSKIMAGLRVNCFPTFLLLDSDLNILYRTCGGGNDFKELEKFINKNFNNQI
ncbi:MAG: TlpA disulfide reductase family protein, partial [Eudoraea sp.]|uniref:TlpA family protein disulfide reductase n=1 Tax=Eudoraea sp. TaxID=1979955 RepID=UPI003C7799A0